MSDTGTIDITDTVEMLREDFVVMAKTYLLGLALAVPGVGPFLSWCINFFGGWLINLILDKLTKWGVMEAFFLNTAIRKASQAVDYVNAKKAIKSLPASASDADYLKAEENAANAFGNFVSAVN